MSVQRFCSCRLWDALDNDCFCSCRLWDALSNDSQIGKNDPKVSTTSGVLARLAVILLREAWCVSVLLGFICIKALNNCTNPFIVAGVVGGMSDNERFIALTNSGLETMPRISRIFTSAETVSGVFEGTATWSRLKIVVSSGINLLLSSL